MNGSGGPPVPLCVRCHKADQMTTNCLRHATKFLVDRVQGHLAQIAAIHSSAELRVRLLKAGHAKGVVDSWLGSIHQQPGKYAANLKDITLGALIHKVSVSAPA